MTDTTPWAAAAAEAEAAMLRGFRGEPEPEPGPDSAVICPQCGRTFNLPRTGRVTEQD